VISIRVKNKDAVKKQLEKAEKTFPQKFADAMREPLKRGANEGRKLARQQFGRGASQSKAFGFSLRKAKGAALSFVARLGFIRGRRRFLANFFERGATIKPKKRAHLYVPILGNRGRDGQALISAREAISQGNTFIQRSRSGNLILFQRPTAATAEFSGSVTPLFALKDRVTLRARPVFEPIRAKFEPQIQKAAEDAVRKAIE
jgi:hypothetical protein